MPGTQPSEHGREVLGADVEVLHDPAPEHGGRHIPPATFLLSFMQHPQHDPLAARQAVANVGQEVPRVDPARVRYGLNSVFNFFFTATPLMVT